MFWEMSFDEDRMMVSAIMVQLLWDEGGVNWQTFNTFNKAINTKMKV